MQRVGLWREVGVMVAFLASNAGSHCNGAVAVFQTQTMAAIRRIETAA
jgi:hypothetical protein